MGSSGGRTGRRIRRIRNGASTAQGRQDEVGDPGAAENVLKDKSRAAETAADYSIGFIGDDLKESDEIRTNGGGFRSVNQTDSIEQDTEEDLDIDRN